MHILHRSDFSAGWVPSADIINGPRNGFLLADNVVLDEQGAVTLRPGSYVLNNRDVNQVPIPMFSALTTVHSFFTATINGVRNQFFGVTNENGLGIAYRGSGLDGSGAGSITPFGSFDGTGDIQFGSFQGMLLAARGTTHWKNDGTNTRTWGIAGPQYKPICTVLPPRVISIATFDVPDQPNWIVQGGEGTTQGAVGFDGSSSGALEVVPNSSTGRGTIQRVFTDVQNLNSFDGGAATGALEDSFILRVWIQNPALFSRVTIAFDVNPASNAPFQDDYYFQEFAQGDAIEVKLDNKQALADKPDLVGPSREKFQDDRDPDRPTISRGRDERPNSDNSGWSKFVVLRGQMQRVGSTPGCDWSTVKAVQISFEYNIPSGGGALGTCRFDDFKIQGGSDRTLIGKYKARYIWARYFGNDYVALSPPSPLSDEVECSNGTIVVQEDPREVPDFQVQQSGGELWAYLGGGTMSNFYRFNTGAEGVVPNSVACLISERDAIIADITLENDLILPPNNPVAIIGPHFNRMIVLTDKKVYIGIEGNPDGFRQRQVLDLADPAESIKWGIKTDTMVYIGTTKDVYRLSGSLALLPDDETDARLEPMGVESPPTSSFVAHEGGLVIYIGSDGFRMLQGGGSVSINWNLDLLAMGYVRYGASLNLSDTSGRMSGAIFNGRLYVNQQGSNYVWVAELFAKRWRRELYPYGINRLYREPDKGVIAGDGSGQAWQLLAQNGGMDVFSGPVQLPIPITLWWISDNDGQPIQYKEAYDWRAEIDTGGRAATVDLYLDGAAGPSLSVLHTGLGIAQQTIGSAVGNRSFRRVQQRLSGSFFAFKLTSWSLSYRLRPVPMLYWDSSLLDFGTQDLVWFRELKFKGRSPVNLRVRVLFDGVTQWDRTVVVTPNVDTHIPVPIGPEVKGRQPLVIVEPAGSGTVLTNPSSAFELYWMSVKYKTSGGVTEKRFVIAPGPANAA